MMTVTFGPQDPVETQEEWEAGQRRDLKRIFDLMAPLGVTLEWALLGWTPLLQANQDTWRKNLKPEAEAAEIAQNKVMMRGRLLDQLESGRRYAVLTFEDGTKLVADRHLWRLWEHNGRLDWDISQFTSAEGRISSLRLFSAEAESPALDLRQRELNFSKEEGSQRQPSLMIQTLIDLISSGAVFLRRGPAHQAVLKALGVPETGGGYSLKTFDRELLAYTQKESTRHALGKLHLLHRPKTPNGAKPT
jgi:hypothetical protein